MTDWPEDIPMPKAVREWELYTNGSELHDADVVEEMADAAIAALVDEVEQLRFVVRQTTAQREHAATQRAEQAEADSRGWAESFKMAEQSIVGLQLENQHLAELAIERNSAATRLKWMLDEAISEYGTEAWHNGEPDGWHDDHKDDLAARWEAEHE
jgi:hypothetical protein